MDNVMNIEQINNIIDKITMYVNQECIIFDDLIKTINEFKYCYVTNNDKGIDNIENKITNKLPVVIRIHNDNVTVFNKNVQKYLDSAYQTRKKFEL